MVACCTLIHCAWGTITPQIKQDIFYRFSVSGWSWCLRCFNKCVVLYLDSSDMCLLVIYDPKLRVDGYFYVAHLQTTLSGCNFSVCSKVKITISFFYTAIGWIETRTQRKGLPNKTELTKTELYKNCSALLFQYCFTIVNSQWDWHCTRWVKPFCCVNNYSTLRCIFEQVIILARLSRCQICSTLSLVSKLFASCIPYHYT